jgi:hypothetical protein
MILATSALSYLAMHVTCKTVYVGESDVSTAYFVDLGLNAPNRATDLWRYFVS